MTDDRQWTFTIMSNWRDWRLLWLTTWDAGWALAFLCFELRSEAI